MLSKIFIVFRKNSQRYLFEKITRIWIQIILGLKNYPSTNTNSIWFERIARIRIPIIFNFKSHPNTNTNTTGCLKKLSFSKSSISRFVTNIISISSHLEAGSPKAQFGKTQFFWDTLYHILGKKEKNFSHNIGVECMEDTWQGSEMFWEHINLKEFFWRIWLCLQKKLNAMSSHYLKELGTVLSFH